MAAPNGCDIAPMEKLIALEFVVEGTSLSSLLHSSGECLNEEMVSATVCDCLRQDMSTKSRRMMPPARVEGFVKFTVPRYTDVSFKEHFRMARSTFEELSTVLKPRLECRVQSSTEKILSFLWMLGNQESYRSVADRFGMSKSTLRRNMAHVASALRDLAPTFIEWPQCSSQWRETAHHLHFPGAIGCIDGTYIPMLGKSGEKRDAYICRKGFPAMHAQVVCNSNLLILDFVVGYPASVHDARVFRNSPISQVLKQLPQEYHLLADSAYPLEPYLMTPYRDNGHLSAQQVRFNISHSTARSCVERCIGLLKSKFRRLKGFEARDDVFMCECIVACSVLHNFILRKESPDLGGVDSQSPELVERQDGSRTLNAAAKRDRIAEELSR